MGLIEGVLEPAYAGYPAYLMAPATFLQRPIRWLLAITNIAPPTAVVPTSPMTSVLERSALSSVTRLTFQVGASHTTAPSLFVAAP